MNSQVKKTYYVWFEVYPDNAVDWAEIHLERTGHFWLGGSQESFKAWYFELLQESLAPNESTH